MQLLEGRGETFLPLFSDVFQGFLKDSVCFKNPFLLEVKISSSKIIIKIFKYQLKANCCVVTTAKTNYSWVKRNVFLYGSDGTDKRGNGDFLFSAPNSIRLSLLRRCQSHIQLCDPATQSNAEAEPKTLPYKNSHKCYSALFLNQCTYGNGDAD